MKARLRIIVAASLWPLAAGTPALAQETPPNLTAPSANEVIGPPQLKDFSLNGTVTRAAPAPAPAQTQPTQRQRSVQSTASLPPPPTRSATNAAAAADRSAAADRTPPALAESPTPAPRSLFPQIGAGTAAPPDLAPAVPDSSSGSQRSVPMLAWIIAALALAGASAWFFLRQRPRESFAGVGSAERFEAPAAEPKAPPAAAPAPKPVPAASGNVSTRLRPWLELEFRPERGVVDEQKAAIAFELSVFNSGNAPARDVRIQASLFNAGPMQDQQIQLFFDNPVAKGDSIAVIPPLQRITVNTAVFLARDQVKPIVIEGRTLFVPMVAFNVLYGWSSDRGHTAASFLVGKQTKGEKLAPFRVDLGSRIFRNLAAREHALKVRT